MKGSIELYLEDGKETITLDILGPGSSIGTYSALNSSWYQFSGRARGSLHLLALDPQVIFNMAKIDPALDAALE